jgi:hypothetical protein
VISGLVGKGVLLLRMSLPSAKPGATIAASSAATIQ